ncbi:MAG: hypothetical protein Ta2A_11060 [Treponemataceae bacterium]|nr:MAG: hypothetical protein Ta2A_11060 [Treponemataceae bacterium]
MNNAKAFIAVCNEVIIDFCEGATDEYFRKIYPYAEIREIPRDVKPPVKGEKTSFYTAAFERKTDREIVEQGLAELPAGKKFVDDKMVDMTHDEKVVAGLLPIPAGSKLLNGKVVPKTEDDLIAEMTREQKDDAIKQQTESLLSQAVTKKQKAEILDQEFDAKAWLAAEKKKVEDKYK